jgi:hypothetical protein
MMMRRCHGCLALSEVDPQVMHCPKCSRLAWAAAVREYNTGRRDERVAIEAHLGVVGEMHERAGDPYGYNACRDLAHQIVSGEGPRMMRNTDGGPDAAEYERAAILAWLKVRLDDESLPAVVTLALSGVIDGIENGEYLE